MGVFPAFQLQRVACGYGADPHSRQINQMLGKNTHLERSLKVKSEQRGTICPNLLGILRESSATSLQKTLMLSLAAPHHKTGKWGHFHGNNTQVSTTCFLSVFAILTSCPLDTLAA